MSAATGVSLDGSATLTPADLLTVLGALSDAAAYREDPGECAGCTEGHGLIEPCPDHAADLDQAAAYRAVAFRLGDDR